MHNLAYKHTITPLLLLSAGHTGPCRWLLLDGVTPDSDPTQDTLSTCDDCRDGCASAPNCLFFTFEGLPTAPFDSSTACPSGPSSPTDYSQGEGAGGNILHILRRGGK